MEHRCASSGHTSRNMNSSTEKATIQSTFRCVAVVFPLHAVRILTMKRVKVVAVVVLLWSILYNVPRYLLLKPTPYWEPYLNRTWLRLEPSDLSSSIVLVSAYFGYINTVVKVVLPVALVSILNVILLCFLHRRRHYLLQQVRTSVHDSHAHCSARASRGWSRRSRSSAGGDGEGQGGGGGGGAPGAHRHHQQHQRVTSVVLAITGVFLLSQVFAGTQVLLHLLGLDKVNVEASTVFAQVCDTVVILVSATNFLLYYAFGEKFRKIIRSHTCCTMCQSHPGDNVSPGRGQQEETVSLPTCLTTTNGNVLPRSSTHTY
ncbi:uncharacterized protein LOC143285720 [Babylonia areolata]|uniref:uncharacterized protein LOC143285720 n=1 Tax=Babylonia areolata TaxID=304850 RepID=UPI003FD2EFA8